MSAPAVTTLPSLAAAFGSARSVEESCNSGSTLSMCWRSTTVKRCVLTSASSRESLIIRSPLPVIPPMATELYGAMLISAGFITGTRTETVPQAMQTSAKGSARTSERTGFDRFFMVISPRKQPVAAHRSVAPVPPKGQLLLFLRGRLRRRVGQGSRENLFARGLPCAPFSHFRLPWHFPPWLSLHP